MNNPLVSHDFEWSQGNLATLVQASRGLSVTAGLVPTARLGLFIGAARG